jgi:hypothetical protein
MDAYCSDTSTLLFSPQEILVAAAQNLGSAFQFEIRVLQNDIGLQPSPIMYHGVPLDLQVNPALSLWFPLLLKAQFLYRIVDVNSQNSDAADLETALRRFQSERS